MSGNRGYCEPLGMPLIRSIHAMNYLWIHIIVVAQETAQNNHTISWQ